ncbi:MAG: hypothetical protein M1290_00930 [Candidatus Thermoplasmatota archaeon]|nr:hypothetical protein [Candidatus Thermoplasmatota archaeon]MCL5789014.1 hypothetical protein [Candidatus Thermoplasmatota archaeon]
MNLNKTMRAVLIIFVEGIVVYFLMVYGVIGPIFKSFYVGQPAVSELPFAISYVSLGIAVGYTVIALVIYPVLKFREPGDAIEE